VGSERERDRQTKERERECVREIRRKREEERKKETCREIEREREANQFMILFFSCPIFTSIFQYYVCHLLLIKCRLNAFMKSLIRS